MEDYSASTTQAFGPLRLQLTEALAQQDWKRADDLAGQIAVEMDKIQIYCREVMRG